MLHLSSFLCRNSQFGSVHYFSNGMSTSGCKEKLQLELKRITKEFEESLGQLELVLEREPSHIECSKFDQNMKICFITSQELADQKMTDINDQINQLGHLANKVQDSNIRWKMYHSKAD